MSGTVLTLESWKNNTLKFVDAHVDSKVYLPGGIALLVVSVALLALLAYGQYALVKATSLEALITLPIALVVGALFIMLGVTGGHMVSLFIRHQEPNGPVNEIHGDL